MRKLINPIILAGFIYAIAVHILRFHSRSIALFLVSLLVTAGMISMMNWIRRPTIEEISSILRESEKKHEEEETSAIDNALHKAFEKADIGDSVDSGRANAIIVLDEDGDGFLMYTGSSGPIMECVKNYGTENERPCEEDSFIGPKPLVEWQQ